jgi:hypothetical protein
MLSIVIELVLSSARRGYDSPIVDQPEVEVEECEGAMPHSLQVRSNPHPSTVFNHILLGSPVPRSNLPRRPMIMLRTLKIKRMKPPNPRKRIGTSIRAVEL